MLVFRPACVTPSQYNNEVGSGGVLAGRVGYSAEDEQWAKENPDEAQDREEYESLMRSLKKTSVD